VMTAGWRPSLSGWSQVGTDIHFMRLRLQARFQSNWITDF
jgi:hypothetical protein